MACRDGPFCGLSCGKCDFCVHQYSCSCPAFMRLGINSCKHIHLLGRYLMEEKSRGAGDDVQMETEMPDECLVRELEVTTRTEEQTEKKKRKVDDSIRNKEELKRQLAIVSNAVDGSAGVSLSLLSAFSSFKAQALEELAQRTILHPVDAEPLAPNSVVVKQKRFYATQKKSRKRREAISTSDQEREDVILSLFAPDEDIMENTLERAQQNAKVQTE